MTETAARSQKMGLWLTTGLVVGSMIGSGIFMLPVSLAPLGANAVAGWLVSICGALAVAFALARLSRAGGGGIQSYIEQPFGPLAGFMVTWAFWCSNWTSQAAVAIAFGSALSRVSAPLAGADGIVGAAVAAIVVLTCVNALGVRASGGLNLVTVAIKLIPLVGVVLLLVLAGAGGEPMQPLAAAPVSIANIATATTLTLFALTGFENATTPVGKVRDPARTLPRAILGGTALVGLIYLLSSSGVLLLLPSEQVAASPAPYADVFAARWGEGAVLVAAAAIAVSAFGTLNCLILATGELGYAMAARRQLPALMARTRGANTPFVAQAVGASLAILLVLANSSKATASLFTFIILLSTSAVVLVYLAGALAAWRTSRSTGVRAVIVLAMMFVAFALYGSGLEADLWLLALLAVGLAVYALMTRLARSTRAAAGSQAAPPGSAA